MAPQQEGSSASGKRKKVSKRQRQALRVALRRATRLEGIRGVDLGFTERDGKATRSIGVRFHVRRKVAPQDLTAHDTLPKTLDGVACDVVEASYQPHQLLLLRDPPEEFHPRELHERLTPGISIGNVPRQRTGTLGLFVVARDSLANPPTDLFVLSNWHVLAGSADSEAGDSISQPGPRHLGNELAREVAQLTRWADLNHGYDAAIARLDQAQSEDLQFLSDAADAIEPEIGMQLVKRGVGSGLTSAIVDGTGQYLMDYSLLGDEQRWMKGYRLVPDREHPYEEISMSGDSGAVWFDRETERPAALHFGGEDLLGPTSEFGLAHSLPDVLAALDVRPLSPLHRES